MSQEHSNEIGGDSPTSFSSAVSLQQQATEQKHFQFLDLPSELLDHVLEYLSPVALAAICQTSKRLNRHGNAERLWKAHLVGCAPYETNSYKPYTSWKELYGTFFPYWFLLQRKIWFSDRNGHWDQSKGALVLAQWDPVAGSIVLSHLHARNASVSGFHEWHHDPNVHFDLLVPKLGLAVPLVLNQNSIERDSSRLQQEASLEIDPSETWTSMTFIFTAKPMPLELQVPSMALWPPSLIPSPERTRRESGTEFRDRSHRPKTYEQMCTALFRLRRYSRPAGLASLSKSSVETYSTILPEYFTPTAEKPYQGLWVGDYSAHGCEFILIIQRLPGEMRDMPISDEFSTWRDTYSFRPEYIDPHLPPASEPDPPGCSGSLSAIKLTGDRNVPRGQLSWVAPDLGRGGLMRIAHEPEFHGARVVSSAGHVAQDYYVRDRYTPCHLIMISEDTLAQHWLELDHISFFKRIDIDEVLRNKHQQ